ncbi:DNA-dependent ATPase mgs1, partial [Spiromyces aspiralis]
MSGALLSPTIGGSKEAEQPIAGEGSSGKKIQRFRPLADRMRPRMLEEFVGQEELLGPNGVLRTLIENDRIPYIIANSTNAYFKEMSAVVQSSIEVKKFFDEAYNITTLTRKRVVLFVDEIHRFNKLQQDAFLPFVERGQIILIGATTENPSFKLNGALLSRCRTFVLKKLDNEAVAIIAKRAIEIKRQDLGIEKLMDRNEDEIKDKDEAIANNVALLSDGDARVAINIVDIAYDASEGRDVTTEDLKRALQRTHVHYGQEEHYDLISALHKSLRGSDDNASLYWLGRMLTAGDDPLYVARRLIVVASEDVGLADNHALPLERMPECETMLAHCVTYLARAPKSIESYKAYKRVKETLRKENPWP